MLLGVMMQIIHRGRCTAWNMVVYRRAVMWSMSSFGVALICIFFIEEVVVVVGRRTAWRLFVG